MRSLKILFILFGILVLMMIFPVAVLYWSPSLQGKLAEWAIEDVGGLDAELEYFRLRFSGTEIRNLKVTAGRESLSLESLKAVHSLGGLTSKIPMIETITLSGLKVDLSAAAGGDFLKTVNIGSGETEPAPPVEADAPVTGIQLPIGIGNLDFDGEIRLPEDQVIRLGIQLQNLQPGKSMNLAIEVDALNLDKLRMLFPESAESPQPVAPDRTPDAQAPWTGLVGTIEARLGRLIVEGRTIEDLTATVNLPESGPVTMTTSARSDGSPLEAGFELAFHAENPQSPYVLEGTVDVDDLEVTPFLRRTPDDRHPILEGVFDLNGRFQSTAPNLGLIAEQLSGSATLESVGNGTFRPLGEKTGMATGVSGILGALSGSVKELGWVREVINQLKEIPYTEMRFDVARDESLDLVLEQMDLISRETRIRGAGKIQYREGAALLQMPIQMQFQLFAKGRLAEALRAGGQLRSEEADARGFYPGPPLPVRGTLAEPESLLQNMLMESSSQLLPGLFGN